MASAFSESLARIPTSDKARTGLDVVRASLLVMGASLVALMSIPVAYIFGARGGDLEMFCWAAATFLVALIPILLDWARPTSERHILLALVALAFAAQYALPILTLYIPAVGPMDPSGMVGASLFSDDIVRAQWISLLGLCAFLVAYSLPISGAIHRALPQRRYEWSHTASLVAATLMITVGWTISLGRQFGLLGSQLGSGLIGGFVDIVIFGSAWLMSAYLVHRSRAALMLLFILVPITMGFNFLTGSKKLFLAPLAMVFATWMIYRRQIRGSWIVGGVAALILIYPVAQFWREDVLVSNTLGAVDVLRNPGPAIDRTADFLESGRFSQYFDQGLEATGRRIDAIGHAAVIIRDTPSIVPFQNGRTIGLIAIAYVPRVLWPGKPTISIGQWITDNYTLLGSRLRTNIGPSWVGELYLNYAIPAVLAGFFVIGLLLRLAHEAFLRGSPTIPMLLAAIVLAYKVPLAVQGGVVGAVNGPIISLIPLMLAHFAIRLFGAARPVAPTTSRSGERSV